MAAISDYLRVLHDCASGAQASGAKGEALPLQQAIDRSMEIVRRTIVTGNKLMFIGNGGSAGIASHLAIDFTKNGNFPALAFNDGAALTCIGNDLGFDQVFARQIQSHGRAGDLLVAISSSGKSADILKGVEAARAKQCTVLTLSGFGAENPLRRLGDINFYVGNGEYGFVEIAHLTLCHAILDLAMGWRASSESVR